MTETATTPIVWQPEFATGVPIIDDQHRVLIGMLNDANARLSDQSPLDDYARIVQGLLSYAGYHFQTEEKLIVEEGYDKAHAAEADKHLMQHKAFAAKVVAVQEGMKAGQRIAKADLVGFLTHWLTDHILHTDKELGAYVRDCRMRAQSAAKT